MVFKTTFAQHTQQSLFLKGKIAFISKYMATTSTPPILRGRKNKPVGSDLGTKGVWFVSTQRSVPPSDNRTMVSSPQLTARIFSELFTLSVKQGAVFYCAQRRVDIPERKRERGSGRENSTGLHFQRPPGFALVSADRERIPATVDKSAGLAARGHLSYHISGVKEDVDAAGRRVAVVFQPKAAVTVLPP